MSKLPLGDPLTAAEHTPQSGEGAAVLPAPQLPSLTGMAMKLDAFNARAVPLERAAALTPDPETPPTLQLVPRADQREADPRMLTADRRPIP